MGWNDLSMADRAKYIKLGVTNGITNLDNIKEVYNIYGGGGYLNKFLNWIGWSSDDKTPTTKTPTITRVRNNDSPTAQYSTNLENDRANYQRNAVKISNKIHNSDGYYIPYIIEKEIKVPGVGRVSSNVLDSIAVNAKRAGISLKEGLGLASVETKLGASPNMSVEGFKEGYRIKNGKDPSKEEVKSFERASLNTSFMRNFGGIYPQFLVNDHEWTNRGWEDSPKYKTRLQNIQSPLEHAFTLYKMGLYNTKDKNHTSKVREEGNRLLKTNIVKNWLTTRK